MRLIDADALVKELTRPTGLYADCERCSWSISNECMDCIVEDVIKHTPTIDPVKHGKWLHNSDRPDRLICSVCDVDFDMWYYETKDLLYCPKCGAKMDGDNE